jgi:hypothetical protein
VRWIIREPSLAAEPFRPGHEPTFEKIVLSTKRVPHLTLLGSGARKNSFFYFGEPILVSFSEIPKFSLRGKQNKSV